MREGLGLGLGGGEGLGERAGRWLRSGAVPGIKGIPSGGSGVNNAK